VRFVAAMTIGMLQLKSSSRLLEPMLLDPSESVRAAALYGLRRCGRMVDLNPLAAMLRSEDPEVKSNAALVLGELGDPSAAPLIRNAVGRSLMGVGPIRRRIVELQLAEAMVRLGKADEMEVIRAALFATAEQGEIAALACLMCGRLSDSYALQTLLGLAQPMAEGGHAPEVRMAAAMAVAQIDPTQAPIEVPMEFVQSPRPELRAQAAMTLAKIRHPAVVGQLRQLLSDSDPIVQVSAAAAILELYAPQPDRAG
jgi:HEAT repeat protein